MQQPGGMFPGSPYTSHVVYVPSTMHPNQQAQYAQMMGAAQAGQFSPQMGGFGNNRQGGSMNSPQTQMGGFGGNGSTYGGMASTVGMGFASNPGAFGLNNSPSLGNGPNAYGGGGGNQRGFNPSMANMGLGMGSPAMHGSNGMFGAGLGLGGAGLGRGGELGHDDSRFNAFGNQASESQQENGSGGAGNASTSTPFFGSGNLLYSSGV